MSRYDYQIACEIVANQRISPESLIMAYLLKKPHEGMYRLLRENLPDLVRECWDRHYGVDGFLRGESLDADRKYREMDMDEFLATVPTRDRLKAKTERLRQQEPDTKEIGKRLYRRGA